MAEAQNWEGEEEEPPEPTEAQRRAAERAEEVRRTRKVRLRGKCSLSVWGDAGAFDGRSDTPPLSQRETDRTLTPEHLLTDPPSDTCRCAGCGRRRGCRSRQRQGQGGWSKRRASQGCGGLVQPCSCA